MRPKRLGIQATCLGAILLVATVGFSAVGPSASEAQELDRQRLIGAAHYENDDHEAAANAYRRCIEISPESAEDHFNLALALMRDGAYDESLEVLAETERLDPELLGVHYIRGIIYKNQARFDEAAQGLTYVTERDPQCFGAFYNLGVCYKKLDRSPDARQAFEAAIALDPRHPSAHYQLITLARRMGDVESAKRHAEIFDQVQGTIDQSEKTAEALERSVYAELIRNPRLGKDLAPAPDAAVRFVDVTAEAGLPVVSPPPPRMLPSRFRRDEYDEEAVRRRWMPTVGGAVALGDVDGDGDLEIYGVNCASTEAASVNRLFVNDGAGRFTEATERFSLADDQRGMSAAFGDFDNDGYLDLYVVNDGPNVLYRSRGDGAYMATGPADGSAGLTLLDTDQPLPESFTIEVDMEALYVDGRHENGFVIIDYQGPEDFVFAGARVEDGSWTIGRYDGDWVDEARLEEGLTTEKVYRFHLRIDGGTVTLLPRGAEGERRLAHEFGRPLHRGRVGLAVDKATTRFDNLRIRGSGGDLFFERFADGRASGFTALQGDWRVVDWGFEDLSLQARANEPQLGREAVFVDYDHDNDLDIFVANGVELGEPPDEEEFSIPDGLPGQVNTLLRNNGDGSFADLTDEAGLLVDLSQSRDVVFADWDGDNDTDLFVANTDADSMLFTNLRLGRYAVGGAFAPPIGPGGRAASSGDFNRDGQVDLLVAVGSELRLYVNNGRAEFQGRSLPLPEALTVAGIGEIETLDYNNDGWTDLLAVATDGGALGLLAGVGPSRFRDVWDRVGSGENFGPIADVAVGDLDRDGDEDLVLQVRESGPRLLMNRGGNTRGWLDVRLVGKKVNASGYGATVEIAAGGHYQKKVVHDGPVHFGIGDLEAIDVVRVTWPNGVAQNIVATPTNTELVIEEKVKVSASCGFLWAHNGERFELINEILGIGPLGAPIAPGVYHQPDFTELTKIAADQLVPTEGSFELRLTEELREIMYADQFTLRVVDHPSEFEIVPNEMFTAPPFPDDVFYAVADARPPRSAVDDRGKDVLDLVTRRDGRFPTFGLVPRYDGLAETHSLTLDLGEFPEDRRTMLYLDGWIYWPEASTVIALSQDPRHGLLPLGLEVKDGRGGWRTAIESVGLPTSKGNVVPVDLTGLFPTSDRRIRLTTNMTIYFDRIFVSTRDEARSCRVTELPVTAAGLGYRGFSALSRDAFGFERFDYDDVSTAGSWSPPRGMLTRYGEVTSLLARPDDKYVIFGPGDELRLRFDAASLPELPGGWTRDFVFYANGWVKDGDLNTKFSETVEPLPFHGMSSYPYSATESYPDTPESREYRRTYNTRPGVPTLGPLSGANGP